jgi:hypothetical protein
MNRLNIGALGVLALLTWTNAALADTAGQYAAKTVWVDGKGQGSMADKASKSHAEMARDGWKFQDLDVYIEDGDMKGLFVTYVREAATAPPAAP